MSLLDGSRGGAALGLAYGVAEALFLVRLGPSPYSDWEFAAWMLAAYVLLGAAVGAGAGFLAWILPVAAERRQGLSEWLVCLVFAIAFLASLHAETGLERLNFVIDAVGLTALTAGWIAWRREPAPTWARVLGSMPFLAFALPGGAWVSRVLLQNGSTLEKLLYTVAMLAAIGLAAGVGVAVWERIAARGRPAQWAALLVGIAAGAGTLLGVEHAEWARKLELMPLAEAGDERPNVVLIVMDTTRADHLSLYGYERRTSPRLEELAETATVFENASAAADYSLPSHASLFTGWYPSWHHASRRPPEVPPAGAPLDDRLPTLAERLSEAGYFTAGVAANFIFFGHQFGLDRGFDSMNPLQPIGRAPASWFFLRQAVEPWVFRWTGDHRSNPLYRHAGEVNRDAFRLLDALAERGSPFFLFLNYFDPHVPETPPPPFDGAFPTDVPYSAELHARAIEKFNEYEPLTPDERTLLEAQYDGEIAYLDQRLGELFDRLKERGLFENTLLIVTADHGESFGDKGTLQHRYAIYQQVVRVPLIVKYPGENSARRIEQPASGVDVMPTVLDAAGAEPPAGLQGVSLKDLDTHASRLVLTEAHPYKVEDGPTLRAIYSGRLKFIFDAEGGRREVYDVLADPNEENNLYEQHAERHAEIEEGLKLWLESAPEPGAAEIEITPETEDRLRSLGYIQ